MIKDRPRRLDRLFVESPLYFVTFRTRDRKLLPSLEQSHDAFVSYATRASKEFNVAVGRYVLMPDHIHLFVCGDAGLDLSKWIGGLKRTLSTAGASPAGSLWQPGFFDHVLRTNESYAQKWDYVYANPVRAGLVSCAEDWPYQGEIVAIDRA